MGSQDIEMEIIRVSTKILVVLLSLPAQGMILTKPSHSGLRNRVEDFNPNLLNITTTRSLCHRAPPDGRHSRSRTVHLYSQKVRSMIITTKRRPHCPRVPPENFPFRQVPPDDPGSQPP